MLLHTAAPAPSLPTFPDLPFEEAAVDGSAGSGKTSTVTKAIAFIEAEIPGERIFRVDSGALYRLVTWLTLQFAIDPANKELLYWLVEENAGRIALTNGGVSFDGTEAGDEIRTDDISTLTPDIAEDPFVREKLLPIQRRMPEGYTGRIFEGRDTTSVVCPHASIRWYLTAHPRERARRRFLQRKPADVAKGLTQDDIERSLVVRDRKDKTRTCCPLVHLPGVLGVNSTNRSLEETSKKFAETWIAHRRRRMAD